MLLDMLFVLGLKCLCISMMNFDYIFKFVLCLNLNFCLYVRENTLTFKIVNTLLDASCKLLHDIYVFK